MIVEIQGAGFDNMGAQMMLASVLDHLREREPGVVAACRPFNGRYEDIARYGMRRIFDARHAGRLGWVVDKVFHKGYQERYDLVREDDIDVLIDISGYILGDPWRVEWILAIKHRLQRLKRNGTKVVLLPQAFGPFENAEVRAAAKGVLDLADLVFARDVESFQHAGSLMKDSSNLRQSPDFTNLLKPDTLSAGTLSKETVALIPNQQILVHSREEFHDVYINFHAEVIDRVVDANLYPVIVLHEHRFDPELARRILERTQHDVPVVSDSDPRRIKAVVGSALFVVGSRFHGLVSALSQGVPSMGTSWSHKYRQLFSEYGCGADILPPDKILPEGRALLESMLDPFSRQKRKTVIKQQAKRQHDLSLEMWAMVDAVIGSIR